MPASAGRGAPDRALVAVLGGVAAQVELGDLGVGHQLAGGRLQPHPAALEDDAVGGHAQPEPHVLLDQQHRRTGRVGVAHQLGDPGQALRVQPQRGLVEQQHARVDHQAARDLDHAALAAGQVARLVVRALGHDRDELATLSYRLVSSALSRRSV